MEALAPLAHGASLTSYEGTHHLRGALVLSSSSPIWAPYANTTRPCPGVCA